MANNKNKLSQKKNLSSMQVIKTLQILLQGDYTMNELIEQLNANESEPIFNNSVVSKYINTCRYCGIEIPKIHNKYFVTSMPFGLELSNTDINLLTTMQTLVKEEMTKKNHKIFNGFLEKLNRYSNKKIARIDKATYKITAELFENAIAEKHKIKLMFKNRQILECIPLSIEDVKGKTFYHVLYKNRERMIDAGRLSGLEVMRERFIESFNDESVIFLIRDDLASRYDLRENEQYTKTDRTGWKAISNKGENKELLLSRLLRYDDKCEIVSPKSYRDEMKQILNDTLNNYGEV